MCVSEQANLGLHPRVRGYKGLAEQLLPVVAVSTHTHVCVCERPTKVKVTRVWPTNFNWEHAN